MRVLGVNKFAYRRGGAEAVFLETGSMLRERGHEWAYFSMRHPDNPGDPAPAYLVSEVEYNPDKFRWNQVWTALQTVYSWKARRAFRRALLDFRPDVVHFHNVYHHLTPSILSLCHAYGVPSVMTLHDYKVVCPSYMLLSGGRPCERCAGGAYYQCMLQRCHKDSWAKSAVVCAETYLHRRLLHSYRWVDRYLSPSRFLQKKVAEMGFPYPVAYAPNFVLPEWFQPQVQDRSESVCYAGRLSREKGLTTLLNAMKGLPFQLRVVGDGPLRNVLEEHVRRERLTNVTFLGYQAKERLRKEIGRSLAVVLPSEFYENNPRSVLEAFALGAPVVGARIGGIPELVRDGETGVTFEPGNAAELRDRLSWMHGHRPEAQQMGRQARWMVEHYHSVEHSYARIMEVYQQAIEGCRRSANAASTPIY